MGACVVVSSSQGELATVHTNYIAHIACNAGQRAGQTRQDKTSRSYTTGMQVWGKDRGQGSKEHGVWILPPSVRGCVKCPARACILLQGWLQEIPDDWSSGLPIPRYHSGVPS